MEAKTIKRRLHHSDADETKNGYTEISQSESISQPLLRNRGNNANTEEDDLDSKQELSDCKRKGANCWTYYFSRLISQCANWIELLLVASRKIVGRFLSLPSTSKNPCNDEQFPTTLNSLQEQRLANLKQRLEVSFDASRLVHQDALRKLWRLAYPNREYPPLKSDLWKEMGWQGSDPSTDFRSGGYSSLENLIFFAEKYPESFQRLLHKQDGKRSEWEYPFAAAGVNLSFMLTQMLGLRSSHPISKTGAHFLKLLGANETAFDNLYCVAFTLLDSKWIAMRASYMEFNEVLKSTRIQLENELGLKNINRVEDLPAYHRLIQ